MSETIYDQEMRRRKLSEAIMQSALRPGGVYNVSGRTVPYSPVEGFSQLGQAYFARKIRKDSERRIEEARQRQEQKAQQATQRVIDLLQGGPYRLSPEEQFDDEQIPGLYTEPDPQAALLAAATDPNIQNKNLTNVIAAMTKSRGDYFTPEDVVMPDGTVRKMVFDRRRNKWSVPDIPGLSGDLGSPRFDPETQQAIAESKEKGKIVGGAAGQAEVDYPKTEFTAQETVDLVDELIDHPGMKDVVGFPDNPLVMKGLIPGTAAADFRARLNQLTGRTFMEIFPTLKGGGQITEVEGEKGQQSINRMSSATSEKEFIDAANDFKREVNRLRGIVSQRAGKPGPIEQPIEPEWNEDKERRYQEYKRKMLK